MTRGLRTRATVGALAGVAVALAAGCVPCGGSPEVVRSWNFEQCTGGELCGWRVVAGSASRVDTLVAGERGLALAAGTQIEHPLEAALASVGTERVTLLARCDAGATIAIEHVVAISEAAAEGDAGRPAREPLRGGGTARPGTSWGRFDVVLLRTGGAPAPVDGGSRMAFSLRISASGAGGCMVDNVTYSTTTHNCR